MLGSGNHLLQSYSMWQSNSIYLKELPIVFEFMLYRGTCTVSWLWDGNAKFYKSSLKLDKLWLLLRMSKNNKEQPIWKYIFKISQILKIRCIKKRERLKKNYNRKKFISEYLTLLSLLCENVSNKRLLKNFLFDKEMPESLDWQCRRIPRSIEWTNGWQPVSSQKTQLLQTFASNPPSMFKDLFPS